MSTQSTATSKESGKHLNRRKFLRIELEHQITLLDGTTKLSENINSAKARTLDLSVGGMRLLTDHSLQNESAIQFVFDDAFFETPLSGKGHIAWCNKQHNAPGYQAGIVFEEQQFAQQIEFYLSSLTN